MAKPAFVNGAAWPGTVPQALGTGIDQASQATAVGSAKGLVPQEQAIFRLLRRRYATPGGTAVNVSVPTSATSIGITFLRPEPDTSYGVTVTPSWPTTVSVSVKVVSGCTISFGTAAPANSRIDYTIFRSES